MKKIAVIGGGPFGIFSALKLSEKKDNQVVLFESSNKLGGLAASEKYKGQYLDYTTKFIPCNQFGKPGIYSPLNHLLKQKDVLLEDIGDYHFLKDNEKADLPPFFEKVSKFQLLKEAIGIYKYFSDIDQYSNMIDLENIDGFERNQTFHDLFKQLGLTTYPKAIDYFSTIFGNSIEGAEALSVVTSRNSYTNYNYLKKLFTKNRLLELAGSFIDKSDLLNKHTALPFKFLMLTTGYDIFLQSLLDNVENADIMLNQTIVDIDKDADAKEQYHVINDKNEVFSGFNEVVLALPMQQLKKFRYHYINDLVAPIRSERHNYVLTSFCNLESEKLKYLEKGIYLDYNNPHKIGTSKVKKDGSKYGLFKCFHADTMFQSLTMVNDIDREKIDETFIHDKWYQATTEFKFDISPSQVKPYGWRVVKWNSPFVQVGDFDKIEKLHRAQGKQGIWFGGEIMSGPGVPITLKYIEDLFRNS
ncbi:hypothetical protein FKG94_21800 [Exilibacterium tricleocarpae]|uniref:Amine oxidase domain-containing protein n=1 Tax=Exilibacterium tricleocarpae TaxID=2591008 RepID=A0A545SYW4_9GAMM|nr:FAD-dependent oxidoreductase [Exilibacterium tricleocarpae]TQV70158.1 hypothetical protein FKG94_21800 [Exilibacterium tricleocarpae]